MKKINKTINQDQELLCSSISMKKSIVYIALALTLAPFMSSCKKDDQVRAPRLKTMSTDKAKLPLGTVDGGGGNIICDQNGKQCSILDLVENADREPFLYDFHKILEQAFKEDVELQWKHKNAIHFSNAQPEIRQIFGENSDFMTWYLNQLINANTSWFGNDSTKIEIGLAAFGQPSEKLKTVLYYFTDKELPLLKDQGYLGLQDGFFKDGSGILQLALQDNKGNVIIQRDEFNKLDSVSKWALKIHESMIFLALNYNIEHLKKHGTSKIRNFVKQFTAFTYQSGLEGRKLVDVADVRAAFATLELPVLKARYDRIGQVSDSSNQADLACDLKYGRYKDPQTGEMRIVPNARFFRGATQVSGEYSMDAEFFMKIQIYLVDRGHCIFKPKPCEIRYVSENEIHKDLSGYTVVRDGELLPEAGPSFEYTQSVILAKWRKARLCQ